MSNSQKSTWQDDVKIPNFPKLTEPASADVVVIGGGLTGITTAYLLAKAGRSVIVLEKDTIGAGATGLTTAFLTNVLDTDYAKLIKMYGMDRTTTIVHSHQEAINRIEHIAASEQIECEFTRVPLYQYAKSDSEAKNLKDECFMAERLGLHRNFKRNGELPFENTGYLVASDQAKFHPLKYLRGLVEAAERNGVKFYEHTAVKTLHAGKPVGIETEHSALTADAVIVATYAPFDNPPSLYFKKAMYDSYVIEAKVPQGLFREAMYEDMHAPYHYFRIDPKDVYDCMIAGGEDHRSDIHVDPNKNFDALEAYVRSIVSNGKYEIVRRWIGPILEPVDGLAFIGPANDDAIYYAFGYSGTGMTYATIAAILLTDYVEGKTHPWMNAYRAERFPSLSSLWIKGKDYISEFFGGAVKNATEFSEK